MQGEATITFTQPGVHPPVYVVTSLSTPPWAPLELQPSKERAPSGDFVFEQKFGNVAEGSYQYKIRIGEGHWVVDESKESATDEHGNRNNVVHVRSVTSTIPLDRPANAKDVLDRKDSTMDTGDAQPVPVPFVVVDKVEDKDQPEYGDVAPKSLSVDESKRAADPDPDFEETKTDSPLDTDLLTSPDVPLVVVEDVDHKTAHQVGFGEDAPDGRKLAHVLGSADASPDKVTISSEGPDDLEPVDAQAPLFRHESFQDSDPSLPEPSMDTIEEESAQSSTDHTSSGDGINTPSAESQDDLQNEDELGHGPLLPHETGFASQRRKLNKLRTEKEDRNDEFTTSPLLPHETGFVSRHSDYEDDDFDAAPLLPHETGSSSYRDSEATSEGGRLIKDDYDYEPGHYTQYGDRSDGVKNFRELDHNPTFAHEQGLLAEDYGAPLLPHERGSAAESFSGSERSFSISPAAYESAYPAFGHEADHANESFGGSTRPSFFRSRTGSSTLPNKLPKSDAEDSDLQDPGLEIFPVGREQILERVATIGHKLAEDETHDGLTSPQPSVLSQACSSVDLVPVKSYLSLASVREDEEEEDEEGNADVESLGSPVLMSRSSARFARDRDPLATPHPDDSKQLGPIPENKSKVQSNHTAEPSEAGGVSKSDDAKDSSRGLTSLSDIVASRATVMNTLTPPLTPRGLQALGKEELTPGPETELRQRQVPEKEAGESSVRAPQSEESKDEGVPVAAPPAVTSTGGKPKPKPKHSTQSWKGASIGISALVAVGAVCYYLAMVR